MDNFGYALLSGLAMSAISVTGVVLLVLKGFKLEQTLLIIAACVLFSDAVFHLLPHCLNSLDRFYILGLASSGAAGTVAVQWLSHSHKEPHRGMGYANLINEVVHNFVDGLALGVSWMSGYYQGLSASIAIAAHELPQEVGDFAILLAAGFPVRKLLILNFLVSLTCPLGVLVSYYVGAAVSMEFRETLVPITAGSFMASAYFIIAPLVKSARGKKKWSVITTAALTIVCSAVVFAFNHDHHDHGHHHHHHGHGHSHHHDHHDHH